jgi:hypothetical protein
MPSSARCAGSEVRLYGKNLSQQTKNLYQKRGVRKSDAVRMFAETLQKHNVDCLWLAHTAVFVIVSPFARSLSTARRTLFLLVVTSKTQARHLVTAGVTSPLTPPRNAAHSKKNNVNLVRCRGTYDDAPGLPSRLALSVTQG